MNSEVSRLINLSDILAKCEAVKRAAKLPHGAEESDSHHAFSLALIIYDICVRNEFDLDLEKVLLYALVHDLLEVVTGDENTILYSDASLKEKHRREKEAQKELYTILQDHPALLRAYETYELLDTREAATVFVLDKSCTIWTHFHDNGKNLYDIGIHSKADIDQWYEAQRQKIKKRLRAEPPEKVYELFHDSFLEMREKLVKGD